MSLDLTDSPDTGELTAPSGPLPWGRAANRRMCTGVYVDRDFRENLLRGVYCARKRRVAPSYGFDLVVVLTHAWRAWALEFAQCLAVTAILVLALTREPLESLIAAAALAVWYLTHTLFGVVVDMAAYYRGTRTFAEFERSRSRGNVIGRVLLGACIVLAAAVFITWKTRSMVSESWPFRTGLIGAGLIFLSLLLVNAVAAVIRQIMIGRLRKRDAWASRPNAGRLATIEAQQRHPFTVYSGFRPFIGSGLQVRTWSFAQRLIHEKFTGSEADQEFTILPFEAADLVTCLKGMINEIAGDDHAETRLPGLTVTDQVFIEGTHANFYMPVLLLDRASDAMKAEIAKVIASANEAARHYLVCQVVSWGGEVVTTVFVHVSLQGRTLYLEFSTYALLPTRSQYHVIDEVRGTGAGSAFRAAIKSMASASESFLAPRRLLTGVARLWDSVLARWDGTVEPRRGADIGAEVSARETAASGSEESYFQLRDIFQHSKIIERKLIAEVDEFLKTHHVDTSEFRQRATTILNNGVMNTNVGMVNITGSAIGEQASVQNTASTPVSESAPGPGAEG